MKIIDIQKDKWVINKKLLQKKMQQLEVKEKNFQTSNNFTQEQRLDSLGRFPLRKEMLNSLTSQLKIDNETFIVPSLLQQSHIPIYFSQQNDKATVIIPIASLPICRYFYDTWFSQKIEYKENSSILDIIKEEFDLDESLATSLIGFLIINSFTG